jgi:transposase
MLAMATIDGRTLEHNTLEHIRIQSVRRVVEDGESPSTVMQSFGLCRTTIYPWLRAFKAQGWDGLAESISEGPPPKLTEAQQQRVKHWILGKDPRQYGFDFGLWTRRIVAGVNFFL